MSRTIRTAGHALAFLLLSFSACTAAMAQTPAHKYGFCQGLAGNPRVNNFTRVFALGPSSPPGALSGFIVDLHKRYGGYVTQEIGCRMFATGAEAEAAYRKELADSAPYAATWPIVDIDWLPEGGSALSGGAAAPAPAPAAAEPKPPPPATVAAAAPAAAPAAGTGPKLDRWGNPIPTSAYWFCNSYVNKNSYASAPFVANTLDRSPQEMFEQFLDYLNKRYHQGGTATCNKFATQAEAEQRIAQLAAEAPGIGYQFAKIDYQYVPGSSTSPQPVPASAPKPVTAAVVTPKPAPAVVASKPATPAPAAPAAPASKPGVYVICRSEWNTDMRRFYNPPVDGRGAGYAEWQASYRDYLVKHHKYKGSNFGCGQYPTREAAQKDFESWVVAARQQPTVNGLASPIIITNWKY